MNSLVRCVNTERTIRKLYAIFKVETLSKMSYLPFAVSLWLCNKESGQSNSKKLLWYFWFSNVHVWLPKPANAKLICIVSFHCHNRRLLFYFSTAYCSHLGAVITQHFNICIMINVQFLHTTTRFAIGLSHFVNEVLSTLGTKLLSTSVLAFNTKFSMVSVHFHES